METENESDESDESGTEMQREHEVLSGNSPRPYVTWCPFCREWCGFDEEELAEGLAENHDENFHDGKAASFVLDNSRGEA